jgi:hypothetical protein
MLLGIKDNSGFGNNADELQTATVLMDNTVIRPFQNLLINNGFNKYFQHFALHSWDSKHKKYFEENNINYCDSIYKLNYKLD